MARLSSNFSGALGRPGYGGMLSQNIAGGMQGISDAFAARKQRRAFDSMNSMLTQGDAGDPNVQQSVMAVARQMNVDPVVAQKMIDQREATLRQEKQEQRAVQASENAQERMREFRDTAAYNKRTRENAEAERKAVQMATAAIAQGLSEDAVLSQIPPEHHGVARGAIVQQAKDAETLRQLKDGKAARTPYDKGDIEIMSKTPGMENALAMYERNKDMPGAKASLEHQYKMAQQAALYSKADKPLTSNDIKMAEALVEASDGWFGNNIKTSDKPFLVQKVAKAARDPGWQATPDNVRALQADAPVDPTDSNEPDANYEAKVAENMAANPGYTREEIIEAMEK